MNKNSEKLGNAPIGSLLYKLSTPAIIGMLITALYNLVDTIFLGRSNYGVEALNALTIAFPIQGILMAITLLFGVGAAAVFSVALGEKDVEKAKAVVGNVYTLSFVTGIILAFFGIVFMDEILQLYSTPKNIVPLAKEYLTIIFISNIVFINVSVSGNIFRAEGNAKQSMIIMMIGAGINIVLDPIFIYDWGLGLGVRGAALATAIGQVSSIFYVIYYSRHKDTVIKLYKKYIKIDMELTIEICKVGFPSFIRNFLGSFIAVIMLYYLALYGNMLDVEKGGEIAQAVYGTVNKVVMFIFMPSFGVIQGMQPIIGYNYGAKQYDRIRQVIKLGTKVLSIYFFVGWLIVMIMPQYILMLFTDEQAFIDLGKNVLRILLFVVPLLSLQVVGSVYFQAIKRPKEAFLISSSRQLIFFVPLVIILPMFFPEQLKLFALFAAFPVADFLSVIYCYFLIKKGLKELDELEMIGNEFNS